MDPIQKTARSAGLLYLLLVPLGLFGILYVPSALLVDGDVAATAANIMANEMLFRLSILSALLVQLVNIGVALLLYKLFKPINKTQARLMVIFILLALPIAFVNELNQFAVLILLNGSETLQVAAIEQLLAQVALFLDLHATGILIAQIFWGLWLFPMGWLVYKSGFMPRIIGVFLMIGCIGYVFDSVAFFLFPHFGVTVSEYTFVGELLITFWLLIRGINVEKWKARVLTPA
jgi:hypothetical protein